uniref:Enoyl-CoA hydratase n=1 Tax=Clastoptera arizonana TaxID=38151 RepID=A0A1B6C159_9HEMI
MTNETKPRSHFFKSLFYIRREFSQYAGGSVDLLLNDETGIAQLCFNHPEKKNAISGKMMVELESVIEKLEKWKKGKGVLIYGADNNFCSGGDLDFARKTSSSEGGFKMATFMQHVLGKLQDLPVITVAFIEGSGALGGGAEIAMACDFRLMSNNPLTGIGFVHLKMGIIPAWGGNYMLQTIIGYQAALDLITTAKILRAEEAKKIGLINDSIDSFNQAVDWLKERIKYDISALRAAKLVANKIRKRDMDILDEEKNIFAPLWGGVANKTALSTKIKHRL